MAVRDDFWGGMFGSAFTEFDQTAYSRDAMNAYEQRQAGYDQWLALQDAQSALAQQANLDAVRQQQALMAQQAIGWSRSTFEQIDQRAAARPISKLKPTVANVDLDPGRAISLDDDQ